MPRAKLMLRLTRWLARQLHGLAAKIENLSGPKRRAHIPVLRDPELVALAERYPGAPEHWLREIAAHLGLDAPGPMAAEPASVMEQEAARDADMVRHQTPARLIGSGRRDRSNLLAIPPAARRSAAQASFAPQPLRATRPPFISVEQKRRGWRGLLLPSISRKAKRSGPMMPAQNDRQPAMAPPAAPPYWHSAARLLRWVTARPQRAVPPLEATSRRRRLRQMLHWMTDDQRLLATSPDSKFAELASAAKPPIAEFPPLRLVDADPAGQDYAASARSGSARAPSAQASSLAADPVFAAEYGDSARAALRPEFAQFAANTHSGAHRQAGQQPSGDPPNAAPSIWPALNSTAQFGAEQQAFTAIGQARSSLPLRTTAGEARSPWPALPASELAIADALPAPADDRGARYEQMVGLWSA